MADIAGHREIYKIAVGMFGAVPGQLYFNELHAALDAGVPADQLYDSLAGSAAFQSGGFTFTPSATNDQFASAFLARLLGNDVSPAAKAFALDFVTERLEAGLSRGSVMKMAIDALDAVRHDDPDFGAAAQRFHNGLEIAEHVTEGLNTSSVDISVLQGLLEQGRLVTVDPVADGATSGATGGITFDASGQAQSVVFLGAAGADNYTSSPHGDTIRAGRGPDTLTLTNAGGLATAGKADTLIFSAGDSQLTVSANGHDVVDNFGTAAAGGALDVIDLGAFGFAGQQASALANKGALPAAVIDGSTLTHSGFFVSGVARGVAIGTNGGDTFVFVDVDKDTSFNAVTDLFLQLNGVTDLTLANFGF
jgi:hypothetical protein